MIFTLKIMTTTMLTTPKTESQTRTSLIFLKTDSKVSRNSLAGPGTPNSDFSWVQAMLRAAAIVNPVITGIEKKSTKKPENIC